MPDAEAADVVTTLDDDIAELELAVETDNVEEVGMLVMELKIAMLDVVATTDEEVGPEDIGTELDTAMLVVEAGPDETIELEGTVLEAEAGADEMTGTDDPVLDPEGCPEEATEFGVAVLELIPPELDNIDKVVPPIELDIAILELIEKL